MATFSSVRLAKAAAALVVTAGLVLPAAASAQATRTWVSGVGDDVNPCSRTAPCKTFQGAISKTATGGEISVLDPGGFGSVTITKALTIDGRNQGASILAAGTIGVIIRAGTNDRVTLRNLSINGAGTGTIGVRIDSASVVRIERCSIWSLGTGINFQPSNPRARLVVLDTSVHSNTGDGIRTRPQPGGGARTTVRRSDIDENGNGIVADSTWERAWVSIFRTGIADNGMTTGTGYGLSAIGPEGLIRVGTSDITGNIVGLRHDATGRIESFGDNHVYGNDSDGVPTSVITPV
jgi:hypothetical protein